MIQSLTEILPSNFSKDRLNRSSKKLNFLCALVKENTTINNYQNLYNDSLKILSNKRFKYIFTESYRAFVLNKFPAADIQVLN